MPTYPASPQLTIDALLKQPVVLARALTKLVSKRFVSHILLTRGTPEQVAGGSMVYQRSENIYPDRAAEIVGVRGEWPRSGWTEALLQAAVSKYGLEVPISVESIRRSQLDQIGRATRKLANAVVKQVDTVALAAITGDAAVLTGSAAAAWSTGATTIISDIATAEKAIRDQDEGYVPDVLVLNPAQYIFLLTNTDLRSALPREWDGQAVGAPVLTGRAVPLLGLRALETPSLAAGTFLVGQSKLVGTIADEQPDPRENYVSYDPAGDSGNAPNADGTGLGLSSRALAGNADYSDDFAPVFVKTYMVDARDEIIVRAARFPGIAILEPKSFYKGTGA